MRILILEDYRGDAAVTISHDFLEELNNNLDAKRLGKGYDYYDEEKSLREMLEKIDFKPDFIFCGGWFINRMIKNPNYKLIKEINEYPVIKITYAVDFIYRVKITLDIWNKLGITKVLCFNDSQLISEKHDHNIEFIYFPFSFNDKIFKDYKLDKEYDIGVFGRISPTLFPMRQRIHDLLRKRTDIKYLYWGPIGDYSDSKNNPSMEDYAKAINKCRITFTDGQHREVLVAKYNELLACKTVLISPRFKKSKDLELHGFIDNENIFYVNYDDSDEEIFNKMKDLLDNKEKLDRLTNNSYEFVHTKHTNKARVNELRNLLKKWK